MDFKDKKDDGILEKLVHINRITKVVKGGRRFGFSALVVVGNQAGKIGVAHAKAKQVPDAIKKANETARRVLIHVPLREGRTIHHDVYGKDGAGKIILRSAPKGTGIIAGGPVRAVCEVLGIQDVVAKSLGSANPYNVLKDFQETEFQNYVMAAYKRLANLSHNGNIKATFKPALASINANKKQIMDAAKKLLPMVMAEKWILANPTGTAAEFNKLPPFMFNEVKNNNIIASAFLDSNRVTDVTFAELIKANALHYEFGIPEYQFSTIKQYQDDLIEAIKNADESGQKGLKKSQAKFALIERNFQIISNLNNNNMIHEQRPLYFYPSSQRLVAGKEDKGNSKLIVPFEFVGKKLYYGLTATGTHDLNPMPFNPRYPMVGLHANALNTILDNKLIHEVSKSWVLLIIILVGMVLAFGVPSLTPVQGGATIGVLLIGYTYLCFYLFSNQHIWLDLFGPGITMTIGYLGITVYNYIQEEKNKQFLKESFGTYVSPELIEQMYESGEEPSLGGEEGYHTAFFTDIQSFSAFSEKLTASELVFLLNQYLTDMTDVLLENNGTLDKYIGDAIVAFYGAPIEIKDHEYLSCITAIKMQESLDLLRQSWQAEGDR